MNKTPSVYIVEDEPIIGKQLRMILMDMGVRITGWSDDPNQVLLDLRHAKPHLVLLDIHLDHEMDGILLATELQRLGIRDFIYITAYHDPETLDRVKATMPLAFIIKPFSPETIQSNIKIAFAKMRNHRHILPQVVESKPLFFKDGSTMIQVRPEDIYYAQAFDNYCYIQTGDRRLLSPHTLKHIESILSTGSFVRTHKSFLVNLEHITSIQEGYIYLHEHRVKMGRVYKYRLLDAIQII